MSFPGWTRVLRMAATSSIVLAAAHFLTPADLIRDRAAVLQGMVGSYAAKGDFELKVHWLKDTTVSPAVTQCSVSGEVGGYGSIHISFHPPDGFYGGMVKEIRIQEAAGHVPDHVVTEIPLGDFSAYGAHLECGDPDPNQPGAPPILYYDY